MQFRPSNQRGNALLLTLLTSAIVGFTLLSYLTLVSSQNKSVMRSMAWNNAIPILEAGVEEALTHVKARNMQNMVVDGWELNGGVYTKKRDLGDGYYQVAISTSSPPVIVSTGYVKVASTTNYVVRRARVTTTNDATFSKGMVAKGQINLNGNNIASDSFDSGDPLYNTGGRYDVNKRKANGDVATNSGLVNSLAVGNADIRGHVSTGPGGSISIGSNGSVGDLAWVGGGNNGIQPGFSSDDMNVYFPDVSAPFSGGASSPSDGTYNGTNYNYVLNTGNYQLSSLSMSGQQKMLVRGNAVLYVTGNTSLSGNSYIYIQPGASLKMYVSGASGSIGGNGVINDNSNATNFFYYGLPSNTSLSYSGNAAFTGVVYAPSATFSLGGGGSNTYDFVGASVSSTVTMNGHFNFHYDENLGRVGPSRGFIITSWNEI